MKYTHTQLREDRVVSCLSFGRFVRRNIRYFILYQQKILIVLILLIITVHIFVSQNFTKKLLRLSYCNSLTQLCAKGKDDCLYTSCFYSFWSKSWNFINEKS
ncbi:hypothetical protein MERGE_001055 [Pneumocystis wakefieldiae]|uniref:Uncharacterized protein n=1 Tax=Pneumocystis wakefieldiae TaxID=38082 RepID=A0A899FY03_9ASCO|nr:hypothetical protein MERGE_001055 [Pneumocystis wakefieldiae]